MERQPHLLELGQALIDLALYQPDIPQNTGTIIRMAACLDMGVHIIEPAGFQWSLKSFRRAGMDYADVAKIIRHDSFEQFMDKTAERRKVLATTKATTGYCEFAYQPNDIVLFGRESAGVPEDVQNLITAQVRIPLKEGMRSLNIAVSAAMITGEALRQTGGFPTS